MTITYPDRPQPTTRAERFEYVADLIELNPDHFDYREWALAPNRNAIAYCHELTEHIDRCGTTACIAGWAVVATHHLDELPENDYPAPTISRAAADWLGFDTPENDFFYGARMVDLGWYDDEYEARHSATPSEAAKLCRIHADELDQDLT